MIKKLYFLLISTLFFTQTIKSNGPFISGKFFRDSADHIMESSQPRFEIKQVKNGDIIFVKTDYLVHFIYLIAPKIKVRYSLLTHQSDLSSPGKYRWFLETENLVYWLCLNPDYHHPKIIPIPIGIRDTPSNAKTIASRINNTYTKTKTKLLYLNMRLDTHHSRKKIYALFKNKQFCTIKRKRTFPEYMHDMSQHKFVLSPPGRGLDCHRTWEALLVGSIPILKSSPLDPLFTDMPVLIVKNYEDITEQFLQKKYLEISTLKKSTDKAYVFYWHILLQNIHTL